MSTAATHDVPQFTLGTRLYMARKHAGLEQRDLSDALGVSRALVSQWERDKGPGPRHAQVEAWAEATGISLRWLHGGYSALESTSGYKQDARLPLLAVVPLADGQGELALDLVGGDLSLVR